MRVKLWGTRGSIPTPGSGPAFGGNTSCVQVTCDDGSELVLDAGTGIRVLGAALARRSGQLHVLLTHLHLDHIQACSSLRPSSTRVPRSRSGALPAGSGVCANVWPATCRAPSRRWRSGICPRACASRTRRRPLAAGRVRDPRRARLPPRPNARVSTRGRRREPVLPARSRAGAGGGPGLDTCTWISGLELAAGATVLVHDCQYFDDEYGERTGWGHSRLADALAFARRAEPERTLLFHHDPDHDDVALGMMLAEARGRWDSGPNGGSVDLAREGDELLLRA